MEFLPVHKLYKTKQFINETFNKLNMKLYYAKLWSIYLSQSIHRWTEDTHKVKRTIQKNHMLFCRANYLRYFGNTRKQSIGDKHLEFDFIILYPDQHYDGGL